MFVEPRHPCFTQGVEEHGLNSMQAQIIGIDLVKERFPQILPHNTLKAIGKLGLNALADETRKFFNRGVVLAELFGADSELGKPKLLTEKTLSSDGITRKSCNLLEE